MGCGTPPIQKDRLFSFLGTPFYIRVVDQSNTPVVGAKMVIVPGRNGYFDNTDPLALGDYFSDKDGFIEITTDGRGLYTKSLYAEGYHIDFKA